MRLSACLRSPVLEIVLMLALLVISFAALGIMGAAAETPEGGMPGLIIVAWLLGFFLLSFAIAVVAVIGGIGGGMLFTPFMLAFTNVDSLIIRGTGMIVAMFSGLISSGRFMHTGLANLKICVFACVSYAFGAFGGAITAVALAKHLGKTGDSFVRLALGVILLALAVYFIRGGKKIEWPEVASSDRFTDRLRFTLPYYERSLGRVVTYVLRRAPWFFLSVMGVGLLSGFFGLGAGWAIVPAQNLILGVPLKVAAANSGVLVGMGDCVAIWPYIHSGAIIPLFVAPWLVGQVLGGIVGSRLLISIKAGFVRFMLIGFMLFSCYGLLARGLEGLGLVPQAPMWLNGVVLAGIFSVVVAAIMRQMGNSGDQP